MKLFQRTPPERHDYDLEEVLETAAMGRRLVIYDRATGLIAFWYLQLRAGEEIARARRYGKSLSLVSAWASTKDAIDALAAYFRDGLRDTDLAGYLNNGHFVLLLPETGTCGAAIVEERVRRAFGDTMQIAAVAYPDDGETFEDLLERAKALAGKAAHQASA